MKKRGFTLIEILVVSTLLAVLAVIGVTSYASISTRSRDAKRISDLEQVRSALEMFRTDNGSYPISAGAMSTSLAGLVTAGYMPVIPKDPKDPTSQYYYKPVGAAAPYYQYCICAQNETVKNTDCAAMYSCQYYLKNP